MIPKRMHFNGDWINNVAILSRYEGVKDKISVIYVLYGEMLTIKDFLESSNKSYELTNSIENIGRTILIDSIFNTYSNTKNRPPEKEKKVGASFLLKI